MKEIDKEALFQYLSLGFVIPPRTIWEGIRAEHPIRAIGFNPYQDKINDREALIGGFTEAMLTSVKLGLQGVNKVGVFLSGGIDSALVLSMVKKASPEADVTAFTVGTYGKDSSDLPTARISAKHSGVKYVEMHAHSDYLNELPRIVGMLGQPNFDCAAIASYHLGKEAEKHGVEKVFLGQNADTPMASPSNIHYIYWALKFHGYVSDFTCGLLMIPAMLLTRGKMRDHCRFVLKNDDLVTRLLHFKATPFYHNRGRVLKTGMEAGLYEELVEAYGGMASIGVVDALVTLEEYYTEQPHCYEALTKVLRLPYHFPYYDRHVIEMAYRITDRHRAQGHWNKMILRDLARRYVAPELYMRRAKSLVLPLNKWLTGELGDSIYEYLSVNDFINSVVNVSELAWLFDRYPEQRGDLLYQLLVLAIWHWLEHEGGDSRATLSSLLR